jgi:hypothetical protein
MTKPKAPWPASNRPFGISIQPRHREWLSAGEPRCERLEMTNKARLQVLLMGVVFGLLMIPRPKFWAAVIGALIAFVGAEYGIKQSRNAGIVKY